MKGKINTEKSTYQILPNIFGKIFSVPCCQTNTSCGAESSISRIYWCCKEVYTATQSELNQATYSFITRTTPC